MVVCMAEDTISPNKDVLMASLKLLIILAFFSLAWS